MKKYFIVESLDASGENGSTWYEGNNYKEALKEWHKMKSHLQGEPKLSTGALTSSTCQDEDIRFTSDDETTNIIYTFNW